MRALVQRVSAASVEVDGRTVSSIGRGMLVLLGVALGDDDRQADWLADKTAALRIFEDGEGKMNLSLGEVGGEVLVVSQFTLVADTSRGNRPSFTSAAPPGEAERLYMRYLERLRHRGVRAMEGVFRAEMKVALVNEGPVTVLLERTATG